MNEIVSAAEALLAQCAQQQLALVESRRIAAELKSAADPRPLLVELLLALFQAAPPSEEPPPAWLVDTAGQGMAAVWRGLDTEQRLSTGLAPRWAALLGSANRGHELASLLEEFGPLLDSPRGAALANMLLRQSRKMKDGPQALRLLGLLAPGWRPGRPWSVEYVVVLGFVARHDLSLTALGQVREWAQPLAAALARPTLDEKLLAQLLRNLPLAARRTVDLGTMRRLCSRMLAEGMLEEHLPALVQMLGVLMHFDRFAALGEWVRRVAEAHPGDAGAQWLKARWGIEHGTASPQDAVALIEALPPGAPGMERATRWMAGTLFHQGSEDAALAWYRQAAGLQPLPAGHQWRLAQLAAKLEPGHPDAQAIETPRERLDLSEFPDWVAALQPLSALVARPLHHPEADGPGLSAVEADASAALAHFQASLESLPAQESEAALALARLLVSVADGIYRRPVALGEQAAGAEGPAYGLLDPLQHRVVMQALYRHAVALCEHTLARDPLLAPHAPVRGVLEAATLLVDHALLLGEPARALQAVTHLRERLGPVGIEVLARLEERCHLEQGDLAAAEDAGRRAGSDEGVRAHPVLLWPEWSEGQEEAPLALRSEPAWEAGFEVVRADGSLRRHARSVPPTALQAVRVQGLTLRNSFVALNEQGALLAPEAWQLARGEYPPRMPGLANRGRHGVTLEPPARIETVDQPVLVLAEMDAVLHRHPYHWHVQILSRIFAAREAGLLAERKLLVPSELSSWMRETLAPVGLGGQSLAYGREQALLLEDALVVQPLARLSRSLAQGLGHRLRSAARARGKFQDDAPGRLLFLSRRSAASRSLAHEDRIISLAEGLGFEIVETEGMGAMEQVALFATARGVAGALGAGFTQLLYAPAGARVLALSREAECPPDYLDLALMRGQHWRWLLGRSDARFTALSGARVPFEVDLALAERELAWVSEAVTAPAPAPAAPEPAA